MAVSSRASFPALFLMAFILLTVPASAQEVYTGNGSNSRIVRLDFANRTTTIVNRDKGGRKFLGLALRDDGADGIHLIIGDRSNNSVLFYPNAQGVGQVVTTEISVPDGPSVDDSGNLYLVSAGERNTAPGVWKIPRTCPTCVGGYGTPQIIDSPPSSVLTDTLVVRTTAGSLVAGDLLVLSQSPARVYRYHEGSRTTFTSAFASQAQPTGFAFTPGGELLVATAGGTVLRFNASGTPQGTFVSGLGKGIFKIAAGMQFGTPRAFIASRTGGTVVRYEIQANGTGTANGSLASNIQTPNGVALTPRSSGVTPVGSPVTVQPLPDFELIFDRVTQAGFTTAEVVEFEDNRGESPGDQSLRDFFPLSSPYHTSLPDVTIPWYVRGLGKNGPTGAPTFVLAIIDTTAKFEETAEFHGFEHIKLGWDPECPNFDDYAEEPRTFYAPEVAKGELPLVDGNLFTDISKNCGSNRGGGWSFSLYLTARDVRDPDDILADKLTVLRGLINDFSPTYYDDDERDLLIYYLDYVEYYLSIGDRDLASLKLGYIINRARDADIDNSTRNVSGELIARAQSAKFFACKGESDFQGCIER
jgi:hypothetical protein